MGMIEEFNSLFDFVDQIEKDLLFNSIIIFITLMYIWQTYLSYRQYRVEVNTKELPKELAQVLDKETFEKSRSYAIDKAVYNFIHSFYSQLEGYVRL